MHPNRYPYRQRISIDYATSTNIEKTGSIRAKTKAEFLENLNAKLAKQGMSGRAFAVRNLINSKALVSSALRQQLIRLPTLSMLCPCHHGY